MEISEIKQHLTLANVLQYYGLKPDKNLRLHCPFHDDKTPSLQVYYKTHTCYCFSSNCKTHGKSLDVIDFVMYKENLSKHAALKKCSELAGGTAEPSVESLSRETFMQKMFTYFRNAVSNSSTAKEYLQQRNLDYKRVEVGYNGGQFHHGTRRDETLISQCLEFGLLLDKNIVSKTGDKAYGVFGKNCIVFPLKDKNDKIVSLYFRSTMNDKDQRHFYLKNRQGLYPCYPDSATKTLILTESIIDTATLLQITNEQLGITNAYSVLSCYGTNGLTEEHLRAIKALNQLEEIIFFFDGDEAGRKATEKYAETLRNTVHCQLSTVNCPNGEDVNSLLQSHEPAIFQHLIESRKEISFIFSNETSSVEIGKADSQTPIENKKSYEPAKKSTEVPKPTQQSPKLSGQPHNLVYQSPTAVYTAKGLLKNPQDSLKVALQIRHPEIRNDYRGKLDLYEYKQLQQIAKSASEVLQLPQPAIEQDLMEFTHLLEEYKENYSPAKAETKSVRLSESTIRNCVSFLQSPDLLSELNRKIGESGIVGEESNRLFLFLIATSYKMPHTLHALIQGSSGSGKTRLMQTISKLMPPEDTKHFTRVTDSSFYNYGEYDLENKLLCFEDIDGLKEEALLALRELQSNDILISSTSIKDENGKISSGERTVRGPIASLSATTKGDYYEDNISRSFVLSVDESPEQTQRIIDYQNRKAAGLINSHQEHQVKEFIQNCVRLLKPLEVVNPYAHKIQLPREAHKIRRLNEMYQSIVKQIVILHQYQRKQDKQGRLIAGKSDLQYAGELLFESIVLKIDELEGDLRQFFEKLKQYVQNKSRDENKPLEDIRFNRFEIRTITNTSKTQQHRYIQQLLNLEYLQQYGYANRGYSYRISLWDNLQQVRQDVKDNLLKQMKDIEN